jgi:hypothetical protein
MPGSRRQPARSPPREDRHRHQRGVGGVVDDAGQEDVLRLARAKREDRGDRDAHHAVHDELHRLLLHDADHECDDGQPGADSERDLELLGKDVGQGEPQRRDGTFRHAALAAERLRQLVPDDLFDGERVDRGVLLAHSAPTGRSS